MTTVEQFLEALAVVESSNNPEAWGDHEVVYPRFSNGAIDTRVPKPNGLARAMGRWQVHPDRLVFEAKRLNLWPTLGETYDSWVERILRAIFAEQTDRLLPNEIAMCWHVGHVLSAIDPDWDAKYAARFGAALLNAQEDLP